LRCAGQGLLFKVSAIEASLMFRLWLAVSRALALRSPMPTVCWP